MIGSQINCRAGLYLRLSNEDDNKREKEESGSITNQRALLTKYAQKNGIRIIDEYIDDGYSGTSFDRPNFKRMLEDIKRNRIDVVITKDMSRLGREHIDTCFYIEKFFPENNIRYISVLDGIDTALDDGINDITPFKAVLNDMYAKDISKKIRSVKRNRAEAGLYMGTYAPYGYKKDPENKNHLIIDQEVAPIVKRIFEYGARGIAPMQIAYILSRENIPTPATVVGNKHSRRNEFLRKDWKANVIRRMLENELYIGNMVLGKSKKVNYKSKKIVQLKQDQWLITKNTHDPIVSKEIFQQAKLHLASRKLTRTKEHTPILKGMITCKECGKKLGIIPYKNKSGKTILYFRCNTYASSPLSRYCTPHTNNIEKVTEIVVERIKETCQKYMDEKKFQKIAKDNIIEKTLEEERILKVQSLKNELRGLENKIDRIYDDKLNEIISEKDFTRLYDNYSEKRKEIEQKIKEVEKQEINEYEKVDIDKIVKEFINMKEITPDMIVRLVSKIELSQDKEIFIHYRFKELEKSNPLS